MKWEEEEEDVAGLRVNMGEAKKMESERVEVLFLHG